MTWKVHPHARLRMEEHGITELDVAEVLANPLDREPDPKAGRVRLWGKRIGVVVNPVEKIVLTVKPSRDGYNHPKTPRERHHAVAAMAAGAVRAARRSNWTPAQARALIHQHYSREQIKKLTGHSV